MEDYISTRDIARTLGLTRQAIQKMLKGKTEVRSRTIGTASQYQISTLPLELQERLKNARNEAAHQMKDLKPSKNKDIHFEAELWKAADRLRGNIDVSEYKHVVLGLLFLKYVSDSFYKRREQLEEATRDLRNKEFYVKDEKARKGILETQDFYKSKGVFYIPEKARWAHLQEQVHQSDFGKIIDKAMDLIEADNAELAGVLPKIFTRLNLDKNVLSELINIFSRISFDHDFDREKDILGGIYEYFLGQFASAEGKRGGEFFTPRPIVRLLAETLEPDEQSRVFDPAAGSGGMFVAVSEFLRSRDKEDSRLAISGQELNQTTMRLCKMNLAIRGISGNIQLGNTYYDDRFPDLRADIVMANPPFNGEWEPKRLSDNDPRIKYGVPPSGNANFLWIQHFIHHLAPNGMAGFVMANGALAVSGKEGEIRKKIIENDLIEVIISCPPKLFYNVALPVSLWFAAKNKKSDRFGDRSGKTLFIDAREEFEQISRKQVIFNSENIKKIVDTVRAWRGEKGTKKYEDVAGFCKSATLAEIAKNGYVLTPGRYVGIAEEVDDGIPFEEKMENLSNELKEAFKEGEKLEKEILSNLKKLGV